jgi:hypothetical protein
VGYVCKELALDTVHALKALGLIGELCVFDLNLACALIDGFLQALLPTLQGSGTPPSATEYGTPEDRESEHDPKRKSPRRPVPGRDDA